MTTEQAGKLGSGQSAVERHCTQAPSPGSQSGASPGQPALDVHDWAHSPSGTLQVCPAPHGDVELQSRHVFVAVSQNSDTQLALEMHSTQTPICTLHAALSLWVQSEELLHCTQ